MIQKDMALTAGDRLGAYEILSSLGAGGMGEVYRARDSTLGREVAIKILPAALAQDPERLARFEREARVLASLNHPNIAHVYGLERGFDQDALVMELVEGETLPQRWQPLKTALDYARQIAEALEAAHEKGIVHRDLKPANIMITPAGVVKVLDFGLAAAPADPLGDSNPGNSPTLTLAGFIVGTAAYMSPEQAAGKPVDKRADIWSFGVVLWEMLTGECLFQGETTSLILADVLRAPIDFDKLPKDTPEPIRTLLRRCLDRDVKNRLRDIGEARIAIDRAAGDAPAQQAPRFGISARILAAVAAACLLLLAAVIIYAIVRPSRPTATAERVIRMPLVLPGGIQNFLLSPDGEKLLFTTEGEKPECRIYSFASGQSRPLAARFPIVGASWSPDSRWIGFMMDRQLRKIDVATGQTNTIPEVNPPPGSNIQTWAWSPAWGPDGSVFFSIPGQGIVRIPPQGGEPIPLTKVIPPERFHIGIQPLPDGRRFLFSRVPGQNGTEICVGSREQTAPVTLLKSNGNTAIYAAPGYLLYLQGDLLVARPFDAVRGTVTGPEQPLINGVGRSQFGEGGPGGGLPLLSASQTGVLVYRPGTRLHPSRLTWFDRSGKPCGTVGGAAVYANPALSPDGSRLAVDINDPSTGTHIWIVDLVRGSRTRLTLDPGMESNPVWSPDGSRIAFVSSRDGVRELYMKNMSGTAPSEALLATGFNKSADDWSADGALLAFTEQQPSVDNVWFLPMSKPGVKRTLLPGNGQEAQAHFSPDGKFVAYRSHESGRFEIFVQALAPGVGRWQISTGYGQEPQWRGDGKEVFYVERDAFMAVDIKVSGNSLVAGIPHRLFPAPHIAYVRNRYAATRDGQRFLVMVPEDEGPPPPPIVVQNWPALLKKN